jgi:glycosyltransferase involved in cell wall biosynthesis
MNRLSNIRILMTADTVGGVWTYATGLASSLASAGAQVHLVSMGPPPRADQREMLSSSVQLIESDLALEWQDPAGDDVAHARHFLADIERRTGANIIHLNSYREATFNWHGPVVVVAHSCVNSWGLACHDTAWLSEPKWQRYSALVAAGLESADAWVAPTRALREVMSEIYQPSSLGLVIHNGATPRSVSNEASNNFIIAAGRMWDAAKNLAVLASAAKDLNWPVFVAGTADQSAGKLAVGIEMLGELSHAELESRMQRAAIFVSPATYEPFGLSVLEAANAGCALVLSDIPSFRELWDGAALFVPCGDADGLRAGLNELCASHRRRTRQQRAALRRARRYSVAEMARRYARLYRSLLAPRSRLKQHALEARA